MKVAQIDIVFDKKMSRYEGAKAGSVLALRTRH